MSSSPDLGLWHDRWHRYFAVYEDRAPVGPASGVTGTLDIINKPAVMAWAKRETAACAVRNYELLGQLITTGGPKGAQDWLSGIPDYQSDIAKDLGSDVHRHAEQVARGASPDVPEALLPYVDAYRRWLADDTPALVSIEKAVFSYEHEYGGTFDIVADLDGDRWLIDIKTWGHLPKVGDEMYSETALQLAAYGRAEFIGIRNDPKRYAMPKIARYGVLHLRPDLYQRGYRLIPFDVTDAEFDAFLGALTIHRWKRDRSKRVIQEHKAVEVAAA